ncbi:ATP synthase F1, delta subunit (macronuclear) [Tetrahymena thermophila SB210]|uniref:ATP synthase F1, delta subunit n=1 Tax=Tetrahymena thermophila (strain SB210) TaxID=312017 RepID=I7MMI7_TETTS|nr:ATP synthase F1, delta subunit [Tetrahymena thermophila SB210]6YNY_G1 Chain G1, Oligomycin sensitivity-conferring protein (OSCP) [Tetrahymena thermophila]6YNY_G2 Chain G2, Oligomycin sensitivity-conferring protein (OSCP) [Tetrahymena thermophila]6YNZ_G1 Chain G1, Oligomycin sensitivity-conferring protein (OSCP) [Tetrahymena thermophila]6YNZ_G2 Chain G2, Oligomycin sensitivity-conferring protein (OSCP) [Tetrahymena thermophila]6YNZ_G4 Chain G4, Oligomycin sensitivity-conferring protein (OSCP|eukprot:XP_001025180.2 ATP synthase F1, delta subunit [Tetrahymena thermophila SB210]
MQVIRKHLAQKGLFNPFLFNRFSTQQDITSVPGDKPPAIEDSIHGKYAGVLFSSASSNKSLNKVAEDMKYFNQLYKESEVFKSFLNNVSLKRNQQRDIISALGKTNFNPATNNLLETLIENKRLDSLPKIAEKYMDYYRILNKQESITIISAQELTAAEKQKVEQGLKKGNANVQFTVVYQVDPAILGGLQMYSGNNFLDCSLLSRVNKLKTEIAKISF